MENFPKIFFVEKFPDQGKIFFVESFPKSFFVEKFLDQGKITLLWKTYFLVCRKDNRSNSFESKY